MGPQATNMFLPLPPPTVSLKSTNDLLMPNPKQRLMPKLLPLTTVDITAVDTVTVLDTVDTTAVDITDIPDTDTDTDVTSVNLKIQWRREDSNPLPPSDELKSFGFR